jgi:hypothetical protein
LNFFLAIVDSPVDVPEYHETDGQIHANASITLSTAGSFRFFTLTQNFDLPL